ncbi:hypothetical protein BC629DRAFT_1443985 [Irpex lacteus]|nr:hypothetical protein BC629DRAFT_1443985 [Irpex lacteus]
MNPTPAPGSLSSFRFSVALVHVAAGLNISSPQAGRRGALLSLSELKRVAIIARPVREARSRVQCLKSVEKTQSRRMCIDVFSAKVRGSCAVGEDRISISKPTDTKVPIRCGTGDWGQRQE